MLGNNIMYPPSCLCKHAESQKTTVRRVPMLTQGSAFAKGGGGTALVGVS